MKVFNFMDTYNAIVGGIIAVLSVVFGDHWILFALFLLFNIIDWLTGWMKSRIAGKENSKKGWKGVLKKLGYWLMILVAFSASAGVLSIAAPVAFMLGSTILKALAVASIVGCTGQFSYSLKIRRIPVP